MPNDDPVEGVDRRMIEKENWAADSLYERYSCEFFVVEAGDNAMRICEHEDASRGSHKIIPINSDSCRS